MGVASTIGIVNQKDDTGKSTSCVNQDVDLAHEGEKALLVDRYSQCSHTYHGDIFSSKESHQDKKHEQVQKLPLADLVSFKGHPFRVVDDDRMMETVESVKQYGVLVPIIARPIEDGLYEIVSGHRRKRACELAGIDEIPVIIRDLDDDEATIIMVVSNLHRENILPSERAKAYQMKLEAIKHQGSGRNETSRQVVGSLESADILGQTTGESGRQVQRFIRLNRLEQPLMDTLMPDDVGATELDNNKTLQGYAQRLTLTVQEAANQIGVSKPVMYKLLETGEIHAIRIGRKILIPQEAVADYLRGA